MSDPWDTRLEDTTTSVDGTSEEKSTVESVSEETQSEAVPLTEADVQRIVQEILANSADLIRAKDTFIVTESGSLTSILRQAEADMLEGKALIIGNADDGMSTATTGAGSNVTRNPFHTMLETDTASADAASLYDATGLADDGNLANDSFEVQWFDRFEQLFTVYLGATTSQDAFFGMYNSNGMPTADIPTNGALTERHIGFIVDDGILYASVADGTTQNKIAITENVTLTSRMVCRIVWDGLTATFYVNGTLKWSTSTNVPASTTDDPGRAFAIKTATTARRWLFVENYHLTSVDIPV